HGKRVASKSQHTVRRKAGVAVIPKKAESKAVREKDALQLGTRLLRDWHGHPLARAAREI
ncbi:MAG: hypothetical protein ACK42H_19970, partial [Planctomycetota bacterium]